MANSATWTTGEGEAQKKVMFHVGDTVRVHYKLIEKEKVSGKAKKEVHEETHERTQAYEGIVIAIKGARENTMFTVRRIAAGRVGMERIFPVASPWIKLLEIKKSGKVRRAKLYYLRGRIGKSATKIDEYIPKEHPPVATV